MAGKNAVRTVKTLDNDDAAAQELLKLGYEWDDDNHVWLKPNTPLFQLPAVKTLSTADEDVNHSETNISPDEALAGDFVVPAELVSDASAWVTVHRMEPNTRKSIYCGRYSAGDFALERLRADHGGGEYTIRVFRPNPANKGRPSIAATSIQHIAGLPNMDGPKPVAVAGESALVLSAIRELTQAMQRPPAAPVVETRQQIIQDMLAMKQLFGGQQSDPMAPIAMLSQLMKMSRDMQPPDPEAGPAGIMMSALERFGPMIGQFLQQQTAVAQPALPMRVAAPIVQTDATAAPAQQPQGDDVNLRLKMGLSFLNAAAAGGEDPEIYADLVMSKLGEDELNQFLTRADWFEWLCANSKEVATHREWYVTLHDGIVARLQDEDNSSTLAPIQQSAAG